MAPGYTMLPHSGSTAVPAGRQADTHAEQRREAFELPSCASSVAEARHRTLSRLAAWCVQEETRDNAALILSELFTNAVVHSACSTVLCELVDDRQRQRLQVRVRGGQGCGAPEPGRLAPEEEHGRGLMLVEALSTAWGIEDGGQERGWSVWAHLTRPGDRP